MEFARRQLGGPTVMAHAFRPFQPSYVAAPPVNVQASYTSTDQSDAADYPIDPKYLRQVVSYDGNEKPGTIIIDTPDKFLYLIEHGGKAIALWNRRRQARLPVVGS